ncbi:MAG TPA: X2-like carbohydrate binding domain-containing protein [Clostridia bacterium]
MKLKKIISMLLLVAFLISSTHVYIFAAASDAYTSIPKVEYNAAVPSGMIGDYYVNSKRISIEYKGIRYWIYDNRMNPWPGVMLIAAYDKNNKLLGKCEVEGARYLDEITVETDIKTVTFYGQGTSCITWNELEMLANQQTPTPSGDINIPQVEYSAKAPSGMIGDYYVNSKKISIMYKGIRYWIYDNRMNPLPGVMLIAAYDKNGKLLGKCEVEGARYLDKITVETNRKTVTFYGQGTSSITWNRLEALAKQQTPTPVPTPSGDLNIPQVEYNAEAPSGMIGDYYVNSKEISIMYKGIRYWIYDNRMNPWPGVMLIAAYDKNNKLLGTCEKEGARYLDEITVETDIKTVTFYGQGTSSITWDELELLAKQQTHAPTSVPTIAPTEVRANESSLSEISVNIGDNTLVSIMNGAGTLIPNVDYTYSGKSVTISKWYQNYYFKTFPGQNLYLHFNFEGGSSEILTIYTGDTPHVVLDDALSYPLGSGDANIKMVPNGNFIASVKNNGSSLIPRIDYTYAPSTNTFIIRKGYLNDYFSKSPETLKLTVSFTGDAAKTIAISPVK